MVIRGPNTAHGRGVRVETLPAWVRDQAFGTLGEIPFANTLADLNPRNNPALNPNYPSSPEWNASGGFTSIVTAWCGACYDEMTDTWYLPLSGGHADYAGNEPYAALLRQDTPSWSMLRPPSGAIGNLLTTNDGQDATGVYADGRRRSIHSYNKPVFVPGVGPCVAVQGACSWGGNNGPGNFLAIDPVTGECTVGADSGLSGSANSSGGGACYDPVRHAVWFRNAATGRFRKYDVTGDSWLQMGTSKSVSGSASLCYVPGHDVILWGCAGLANNWAVLDCASEILYEPSFVGSLSGGLSPGSAQPRWSAALGCALAWNNSSDTTLVTTLTPGVNPRSDPWTIGALTVDPSNVITPSARASNGTYGRFIYSPNLGIVAWFNSVSGPHYFMRVH